MISRQEPIVNVLLYRTLSPLGGLLNALRQLKVRILIADAQWALSEMGPMHSDRHKLELKVHKLQRQLEN